MAVKKATPKKKAVVKKIAAPKKRVYNYKTKVETPIATPVESDYIKQMEKRIIEGLERLQNSKPENSSESINAIQEESSSNALTHMDLVINRLADSISYYTHNLSILEISVSKLMGYTMQGAPKFEDSDKFGSLPTTEKIDSLISYLNEHNNRLNEVVGYLKVTV